MMRRNVYSTCDEQLPNDKKYVAVHLLTLETLYFVVDVKSKVNELFNQVCKYLGLVETELFGLSINTDESGFIFLDPTIKLCKYAPKQWKLQNNGVNNAGKSLFGVYLRVEFYVDSYLFISDKVARLLYYLQLRENVVNYGQALCEEKAFLLASYALQADFGNFNPEKHQLGQYFNPDHYFPSWVIEQIGLDYIIQHLPFLHCDHKGMHKIEAQSMYIKEASDANAPHNLHLYKLKSKKTNTEVWLGICSTGVEIYAEEHRIGNTSKNHSQTKQKTRISSFTWPDIGKLYFEKKKFQIHSVSYPVRKFTYYANSEDMARHLLWLCRITHQFQLIIQSKIKEVKKREQELTRKKFKESYVYSESYKFPIINRNKKKSDSDTSSPPSVGDETGTQRVSVISSASSNTTSGIVSDKVQSLEDSDRDDIDIEIMMNSPAVVSLESLTLSEPVEKLNVNQAETISDKLSAQTPDQPTLITENISDSSSLPKYKQINQNEKEQNEKEVYSSVHSTKSTSSEQSTTTVKSVIPSNIKDSPTTQIITIVNDKKFNNNNIINNSNNNNNINSNNNNQLFAAKSSVEKANNFASLTQQKQQLTTTTTPTTNNNNISLTNNSCAIISQLPLNDLSVKNIDVSAFSKLSERSESMNHIYENIPYFSHFQTPKKGSSPPPLPTSAPPQRTTTRIGISSLTRAFNKPTLSIYKQNMHIVNGEVAGSEPNLYNKSKIWSSISPNMQSNFLSLPFNDNSNEFNANPTLLNSIGSKEDFQRKLSKSQLVLRKDNDNKTTRAYSDLQTHYLGSSFLKSPSPLSFFNLSNSQRAVECTPQSFHQSLNDIAITSTQPIRHVGSEINVNNINSQPIFIPPPPDYANSCSQINITTVSPSNTSKKNKYILSHKNEEINGFPGHMNNHNNNSISDLNQLRQKSRDLDLPLITALFNDRSLMMLPKTVPNCSRHRHVGTPRDTRRFSCSYQDEVNSNLKYDIRNFKLENDIFPTMSLTHRPTSWHLDLPNTNIWQYYKKEQKLSTSEYIDRIWAEHQLTS